MRVEDCIVSVERRSLGGCVDLAFVFARAFSLSILRLTLVFAIPACLSVWLLTSATTDMLVPSILIFLFFSSLYNAALIAAIGPQVFGVPISARQGIAGLRKRFFSYMLLSGCYRFLQFMSLFCLMFPSILVTAHFGHTAEVMMLEQTPIHRVLPRLSGLGKGGGFSRNLMRVFGLLVFWLMFSLGVFFLIDFLASILFNFQIFFGQFSGMELESLGDRMATVLLDSPAFLTTVHASLWLTLPIVRLAWFFCYLDQRIRNECWDLELQFRAESARLEQPA